MTSEGCLTWSADEWAGIVIGLSRQLSIATREFQMPQQAPQMDSEHRAFWRETLAPYAVPSLRRSIQDLLTSVVPYLALCVAMYYALRVSWAITLVLSVFAGGFLVRTFIVFHDCTHGSFLPSKRANTWVGTAAGLLVFSTFQAWKRDHAIHHATAGDLDRRGVGDVPVMTVDEFRAASPRQQRLYRLFRHPLIMFGLGPIVAMIVQPRIVPRSARPRIKRAVIATDIALVALIAFEVWLVGWSAYLWIEVPTVMVSGIVGIWLFYVQHQFEGVYWENSGEWSYADAALRGSSYLKLPKVLQFFSGNIGLHHVHHLNARIPNYNLQRAHDETGLFDSVPVLSLSDGLRAVNLKLYDERQGRLVTFRQARDQAAYAAREAGRVDPGYV